MHETQNLLHAVIDSLEAWLIAVRQSDLSQAHGELSHTRQFAENLAKDVRLDSAGSNGSTEDAVKRGLAWSAGLDFIAAVTEATRPGRYRCAESARSHP